MLDMRKIPVTVITGFLGAGKTSLIRHLLENANGRRIALIINEFGDLGVDGEILRGCGIDACEDEDIVELTNGCLCCTVADEFLPTLEALLERKRDLDQIVIETSGLALPKPLLQAFQWPEVRSQTTVNGVIAVIDGPAVAAGQFASDPGAVQAQRSGDEALNHDSPLEELFEDQLACADMVVMSKIDLMTDQERSAAAVRVAAEVRASVATLSIARGQIDPAIVFGLGAAAEDDLASRRSHHDGVEGEHDHDDFESLVIDLPPIPDVGPLIDAAASVLNQEGILRIKGFAAVAGKDARLLVQGVGTRVDHYFEGDWPPGESRATRIVVIGMAGLDEAAVRQAFASVAS